jgi:MYXO-CTERM domain-containing protein
VHADRLPEGNETLSVTLTEVQGGATLDTRSSVEISVADAASSGKSGGGGRFGGLLATLLGFAGLLRRRHAAG